MKRCPTCGVTSDNFGPNRARKDGLQAECRTCKSARAAAWYDDQRETVLASRKTPESRLRRQASNHGLTVDQLRAMIDKHDGLCHSCLTEPGEVVDHCHATERRRGWLCTGCNKGLGFFRDDTARLERAIAYLGA